MTNHISISRDGEWFVITDEETGVTTQGESKTEALLMLADALAAAEGSNEDLLNMAMEVFVPDPEMPMVDGPEGDDWSPEPPDESRVERNRELALHLAKTHKRSDFSEPRFIHRISSMIHGSSCGLKPARLAELGAKGYWEVFEEITAGARSVDDLVAAGISQDVAKEAVDELRRLELVAEADSGELYAGYEVVTTEPFAVPPESVVDWKADFDHTLVDDLEEDDMPETPADGVFVEQMGTGYGWYHDPRTYTSTAGDVVMSRDQAEEKASMPCPKCFPESKEAERFEVTDMSGGVTRYEQKEPEQRDEQ